MLDLLWGRCTMQAIRKSTTYLFNSYHLLGLGKPTKWIILYHLWSGFMNICVGLMLPLTFLLSFLLLYDQMSISQFLTSLQAAINVFGSPFKVIATRYNMKTLLQAEHIMDALDQRCHLNEEYEKIQYSIKFCSRITVFYIILYMFYAMMTFFSSIIMGQPPYSLYLMPLNWRNSNLEFIIQSLIEYMMMSFLCYMQSMLDCCSVIFIFIMRTHMQILVERVRRLATVGAKSKDENYQDLVECIKDHQNLLKLHRQISPLISVTMFVQFFITGAILGTTLINILIFADTSAQIASVVYLLAVLVQVSPCCYMATCLLDDCAQLPLAIFQCNWNGEDKRFRQMLIFFLQRAQKPLALSAMKLFPITLNTNLSIAKFSFSLYTLIKNMDFGMKNYQE